VIRRLRERLTARRERDKRIRREAKADYREAVIEARDERIAELERQLAAMTASRDSLMWSQWMTQAYRQRAWASEERERTERRQQAIAEHPTSVHATEKLRRQE
jgi:hypothetical protein